MVMATRAESLGTSEKRCRAVSHTRSTDRLHSWRQLGRGSIRNKLLVPFVPGWWELDRGGRDQVQELALWFLGKVWLLQGVVMAPCVFRGEIFSAEGNDHGASLHSQGELIEKLLTGGL